MVAIACSAGNKAIAINQRGERIVVQELIQSPEMRIDWCFHVWIIKDDNSVSETDIPRNVLYKLKSVHEADTNAEIWTSI